MDKTLNHKFYKDFLNQVCVPQLEIYIRNEDKPSEDMMYSAKKSIEENPIVLEAFCKDWREYEHGQIGAGLDYEFLYALLLDHGEYAKEQTAKKTFSENSRKKYEQHGRVC